MFYLYWALNVSAKGIIPQELVEQAWEYDVRIDQAEQNYLASKEAKATVVWDSPNLSASIAPLGIGNDAGVSISLQQPIPKKGELALQREVLQSQEHLGGLGNQVQRLQTQREVLYAYADIVEGREQIRLLLAHEKTLQEHSIILQAQVNVIEDSALFYLDMEIERQQVLAEQRAQHFVVQRAMLRLQTLTGLEKSADVLILDSPSFPKERRSLQEQIIIEKIREQQQRIELVNLNRYPQWSIITRYSNLVSESSNYWMMGIGLDVPFQKESISSEIQQQKLLFQGLEYRQKWILHHERNERDILLKQWSSLEEQEQNWQTQIQLIEEQRLGLEGSFSTGKVDYIHLLQLEHKNIAAQQQLVTLKAERWRVFADWLSLNGEEWL